MKENRLIDVNDLIGFINMGHLRNPLESCFSERDVVDMLESRPTVDAVEVVRCKDCAKDGLFSCPMCYIESHELIFINHDPEFFCAGGEQKEGADNGF